MFCFPWKAKKMFPSLRNRDCRSFVPSTLKGKFSRGNETCEIPICFLCSERSLSYNNGGRCGDTTLFMWFYHWSSSISEHSDFNVSSLWIILSPYVLTEMYFWFQWRRRWTTSRRGLLFVKSIPFGKQHNCFFCQCLVHEYYFCYISYVTLYTCFLSCHSIPQSCIPLVAGFRCACSPMPSTSVKVEVDLS
jgi:hypothetical protein